MYKWKLLDERELPDIIEFRRALKIADLDTAPDARNLMSTLMRLSTFDRIKGQIKARRVAVTAFANAISANDKSDAEKTLQAAARLSKAINFILKYRVQSAMFGAFVSELRWDIVDGKWLPSIKKRYKPVELLKTDDSKIKTVDDKNKILQEITVFDYENDNFISEVDEENEQGGVLRSVARKQVFAYEILNEWVNYNKELKGLVQASFPAGATDDEIQQYLKALMNIVKNKYTLTDEDMKFNFENTTMQGAHSSFDMFLDRINADTTIAILGQANASELPKGYGSNAALQVLSKVSSDVYYSDILDANELINHLLLLDFRRNYDKTALKCPWTFAINIPEEYTLLDRSEYGRNLKELGVPVDSTEFYNKIGMKKPEGGPDILFQIAVNAVNAV